MNAGGSTFAKEFAAALQSSGMSLNQLARRLGSEGLDVSAATLSYWRIGVRNPGRKSSAETVRAVERILNVESGSLLAYAVGERARGRGLRTAPLGRGDVDVSRRLQQLLGEIGMAGEPCPLNLIMHEQTTLDACGRRRQEKITQVLRAANGPISAFYLGQADPLAVDGPWRISDLSVGRVTAAALDSTMRLLAMRVDLPTPLRHGDTLRVDYTLDFPYAAGPTHFHERWLARSLREFVVNVQFDSSCLPVEVESYVGGEDMAPNSMPPGRPVPVNNGFAQAVLLDLPPGVAGLRWRFPDEDNWDGTDLTGSPADATAREGWQAIRSVADLVA